MMSLARFLLPQLRIVVATFRNSTEYDIQMITLYKRFNGSVRLSKQEFGDIKSMGKNLSWHLVILYVNGYGVLMKGLDDAQNLVDKIISDKKTFIYNYSSNGDICFVRNTQIKDLLSELERLKAKIIDVRCDSDNVEECDGEEIFSKYIRLGNILRPTNQGKIYCSIIERKLRLPMLLFILMLLLINYRVFEDARQQNALLETELTVLRAQASRRESVSKELQKLIAEFNTKMPYGFAIIGDRIGALLPEGVNLTKLTIQPLGKSLETTKRPIAQVNKISLEGQTDYPELVVVYMNLIRDEHFVSELKLISMEQNNENLKFRFIINITLLNNHYANKL